MSVNLQHKPFSVPEFWVGGIALATVALIAFGSLPAARPQLPAPTRYASVSIQASEALAKLSLAQPRELPDVAAPTHEVQSSDASPDTGSATPIEASGAKAPHPSAADRSAAPVAALPVGLGIQQSGIDADAPGLPTDIVGAPPLSAPTALPDSRPADGQRRDAPDRPSVRTDFSFVGSWTDNIGRCGTGRKALLIINSRAAKTADGECAFGFVAREGANRWRVAAICAARGNFWRANIALKLAEPNLTWSSERGTETYVRCKH